MNNAITSFSGPYSFLSNFYPSVVRFELPAGFMKVETVEHAFQASKTRDVTMAIRIARAKSPGTAKILGRQVSLRPDWDLIKFGIMEDLLRQKFTPGSDLAVMLLETGDAELIEGNTWNDRIWGQCPVGRGENHLGRLLMKVREDLR